MNEFAMIGPDCVGDFIHHSSVRVEEERRLPRLELRTHLFHKIIIDPHIPHFPHQRSHPGAYRCSNQGDKEEQAKE